MTAPNKMAKRAAAGTLALAVCFTGGLVAASSATAAPGFKFDQRFGGTDRFETAAIASKAAFDTAGDVIIVQDDALADGLTASYLAGVKKAPILYVKKDSIPDFTAKEIDRLKAERITIVGGVNVVSDSVKDKLGANGRTVTRLGGSDRFETAALVATSNGNDVGTVFIANGDAYADALAAGPIAYKSGNPILLTRSTDVPSSTTAALAKLNETNRIVLGGNTVVSTTTFTELGGTNRLGGENRQATAVAIADYATANEGFTKANAALVGPEDRNAADALIAAPVAGQAGTPILFTARGGVGDATTKYLKDNAAALTGKGYVFGGTDVVPTSISDAATAASQGAEMPGVGNQTFNVTPSDAATIEIVAGTNDGDTKDDRVYTVNNAVAGAEHTIQLFEAANVTVKEDGTVTFKNTTGKATQGTATPAITVVNGAPITASASTKITPTGNSFTFRVDGVADETIVPVIFADANKDGALNVDADGRPAKAEAFGVGGSINFQPAQATAGTLGATAVITEVLKGENSLVAGPTGGARSLFNFDANDMFYLGSVSAANQLTLAEFKERLTKGDELVSGAGNTDYRTDPSFQSRFVLNNINPVQPGVTVKTSAENSVTLTVTGVADGAAVTVYGAKDTTSGDPTDDIAFDKKTTPKLVTSAVDADKDTGDFQIVVSGLAASSFYDLYVTQTVDGEESVASTKVNNAPTTATAGDVSLVSVTPNEINDGVSSTATVVYTFSEPVSVVDTDGVTTLVQNDRFTVSPTNQPGIVRTSTTAEVDANDAKKVIVTFPTAFSDAATDVNYSTTVKANAVQETATGTAPNAELKGTFAY